MHEDLKTAVNALRPELISILADLVRVPSVSASSYDPYPVRQSAEKVAGLLKGVGASDVQLLELEGAHPAVFGQAPGPIGSPTVLLYAHHDVQPPGPSEHWETGPFEPFERDGRLFGRGASDDKSGVVMHLGVLKAFAGKPPVGIKVFVEGEEEVGSQHLGDFLVKYADLLAAATDLVVALLVYLEACDR
ncbi:MAG: M20/M25/M40 family metallo-hydrolase, partial [Acidimicrobiia bacterium]